MTTRGDSYPYDFDALSDDALRDERNRLERQWSDQERAGASTRVLRRLDALIHDLDTEIHMRDFNARQRRQLWAFAQTASRASALRY